MGRHPPRRMRTPGGNKWRAGPFVPLWQGTKPAIAMAGIERGGMSSADPLDAGSSTPASGDNLRRVRSAEKSPLNTSDPVLREGNDIRSEKPQANPEAKIDRKPPQTDPTQAQGPKGIKGAFQKHPIA